MTFFDSKPAKIEAVGNGSFCYRFNINITEIISEDGKTEKWTAEEVTVWEPLTANKITSAVIASVCPITHEQKLVNEYNAALLGMIGGSVDSSPACEKIEAYRNFLILRNSLKSQVDTDCAELGIN